MNNRYRPVQLAQQTFPWLSVQVTRVASQKVNPKLGQLGGHICICAEKILQLPDSVRRRLERDGIIQPLLTKLEAALSASSNHEKISNSQLKQFFGGYLDFPLLTSIAVARDDASEGGEKGRQPLSLIESIIKAALFRSKINYRDIFSSFLEISEIGQEKNTDFDDTPGPELSPGKDDFAGYERYAKTLYDTLVRYSSCSCERKDQNDQHLARIRLKPIYQANDSKQIPFDMLFSASPNPPRSVQFDWQDVRVFVPTGKPRRRVQWAQEPTTTHETSRPGATDSEAYERIDTLCTLISSRCDSLLCFKAVSDQLMVLRKATDLGPA